MRNKQHYLEFIVSPPQILREGSLTLQVANLLKNKINDFQVGETAICNISKKFINIIILCKTISISKGLANRALIRPGSNLEFFKRK